MRLGRAGRGRQVLLEDLTRGAVAEAAARRTIEPVGEPPEVGARERLGRALARQEAPDTAVQVLDAALLPGAVRVAEVAGHVELAGEPGIGGELGPAVEGDRAAGAPGQAPEDVGDAGDPPRRALVLVGQQEGEPALPLHQRGHVGLADLPEDQQVGLPVPEAVAVLDLGRTVLDPALARDGGAARPSAVAAATPPARLGQVAVEAVPAALRAVDVAVDRLVADRRPAIRLVVLQPAGDLLRRPAGLQPPDHVRAQALVSRELPAALPAPPRRVLSVQGEVAAEAAIPVAEAVAAELAVDGRGMPAEPGGDLADRGAGLDEAEEGATLVEVELAVDPGQGRLPPAYSSLRHRFAGRRLQGGGDGRDGRGGRGPGGARPPRWRSRARARAAAADV